MKKPHQIKHSPKTNLHNGGRVFLLILLIIDFSVLYPVLAYFIIPSQQSGVTGMILYTAFYVTPLAIVNVALMTVYLLLDRPRGFRRFAAWILLLLFGGHLVYIVYSIIKPI